MPTGVYKHGKMSENAKKKLRDFHLGMKSSSETKRKISIGNTGKKHPNRKPVTEETKRKIRISLLGKTASLETREKISKSLTGIKFLNRKSSICSEGKREKIRRANTGKILTNETRRKISEWNIEHPNRTFKDTSIELKIELELQKRGINYQKQVPLSKVARVDFYLPGDRVIIQCDGCYYHNCLIHCPNSHIEARVRDSHQDLTLRSNGFKVYRFWEHEINESVEECINRI